MTSMTPLAASAIRARRRPLAIAQVYLAELFWALLVATPVHAWAARVWGAHPDGDAVLWHPGGRELLVWLGQQDAASSVVARTVVVLMLASVIAMQVPLGALIASLAFARGDADTSDGRSPRWYSALSIGISAFVPLMGVLALGVLLAILVLAIGAAAGSAVDHALAERLGDARSLQLRIVTLGLFALFAAEIGVMVDLARAAIARESGLAAANGKSLAAWRTMLGGLRVAFMTARRSIGRATLAWAWRALLSLGLVAIGVAASQALGGKGGGALFGLWAVHQSVVVCRVALRASWLARAVALIAPIQDARLAAPSSTPADAEAAGGTQA